MLPTSLESSLQATSSVITPRAETPSTRYGTQLLSPGLVTGLASLMLQGCPQKAPLPEAMGARASMSTCCWLLPFSESKALVGSGCPFP